MSETYRYPVGALRADYVRAGSGLVLTLGPALAVPAGSPVQFVLLPVAALFLIFAVRTWRRQISRVEVDRAAISLFSPGRVSVAWNRVQAIKLSYYSTRADRTGGWMQLTLKGEDPQRAGKLCALRLDSTLEGFEHVVRLATAAALASGVSVPDATRANLGALGIAPDEMGSPELAGEGGRG